MRALLTYAGHGLRGGADRLVGAALDAQESNGGRMTDLDLFVITVATVLYDVADLAERLGR